MSFRRQFQSREFTPAPRGSAPVPKPPGPLREGSIKSLLNGERVTAPVDQESAPVRSRSPPAPGRADLPVIRPYSRGSIRSAMAIASDSSKLSEARFALEENISASTAKDPLASKRETWSKIATAAGHPDPFDLSADLVFDVMSALREAGYRSAESYLSVAKTVFVEERFS